MKKKPQFRLKLPEFKRENLADLKTGVYTSIVYIFLNSVFFTLFRIAGMDMTAEIMYLSGLVFFFIMSVHLFEFYKFKFERKKNVDIGLRLVLGVLFTALSFLLILGQAIVFINRFVPDMLEIAIGLAIFIPMFSWWEILHAKVKK